MVKRLSYYEVSTFLSSLHPLCEAMDDYKSRLEEVGFGAHIPRFEFVNQFAESSIDLGLHKKIDKERAKERISLNARMFRMADRGTENIGFTYSSPFLDKLRQEADVRDSRSIKRNSPEWFAADFERNLDPCERNKRRLKESNSENYDGAFEGMLEEEWRIFRTEAKQNSKITTGRDDVNPGRRIDLAIEIWSKAQGSCGLMHRGSLREDHLVFVGDLYEDWRLYCISESTATWSSPHLANGPRHNQPMFKLGSNILIAHESSTLRQLLSGQRVLVAWQAILPKFVAAYQNFWTDQELERCIVAQSALLEMIIPTIKKHALNLVNGQSKLISQIY